MYKMNLKTKIGMIFAVPLFIVFVVGSFLVSILAWLIGRFLHLSGTMSALDYLIGETNKKIAIKKIKESIK